MPFAALRLGALFCLILASACDHDLVATPASGARDRAGDRDDYVEPDTAPADDYGALFYQEPDAWSCAAGETLRIPFDVRRPSGDDIFVLPPQVMICYDADLDSAWIEFDPDVKPAPIDADGQRICRTTTDFVIIYEMPLRYDHGRVVIQCQGDGYVLVYRSLVPARCAG